MCAKQHETLLETILTCKGRVMLSGTGQSFMTDGFTIGRSMSSPCRIKRQAGRINAGWSKSSAVISTRLACVHQPPKDDVIRYWRPDFGTNLLAIRLRLIRVTNKVVDAPVWMHRCVPLFEKLDETISGLACPQLPSTHSEFSFHAISPRCELVD